MKRCSFWIVLIALFSISSGYAQTTYPISEDSFITVDGTSNKSDWSVKAEVVKGSVDLTDGMPTAANLVVLVDDIKSGKALLMDRLMKGSFKSDEHPEIHFVMTSADAVEDNSVDVHGMLSMAGSTNPVTIRLLRSATDNGGFLFTGKTDLNMRDYGMDPPSAMFGSLLTKAEVVINFNIVVGS